MSLKELLDEIESLKKEEVKIKLKIEKLKLDLAWERLYEKHKIKKDDFILYKSPSRKNERKGKLVGLCPSSNRITLINLKDDGSLAKTYYHTAAWNIIRKQQR